MAADKLFVNGAVFDGRRHRPGLSVAPDLSDVAAREPWSRPMSRASWSSPADLVIANGWSRMDRSLNAPKAYRFRRRCG
jgi:hypothetical protein